MIMEGIAAQVESFRTKLLTIGGRDIVGGLIIKKSLLDKATGEMDRAGLLYKDPYPVNRPPVPTVAMLNGIKIECSELIPEHFVVVVGSDQQVLTVLDLRGNA